MKKYQLLTIASGLLLLSLGAFGQTTCDATCQAYKKARASMVTQQKQLSDSKRESINFIKERLNLLQSDIKTLSDNVKKYADQAKQAVDNAKSATTKDEFKTRIALVQSNPQKAQEEYVKLQQQYQAFNDSYPTLKNELQLPVNSSIKSALQPFLDQENDELQDSKSAVEAAFASATAANQQAKRAGEYVGAVKKADDGGVPFENQLAVAYHALFETCKDKNGVQSITHDAQSTTGAAIVKCNK